MPKPGSDILTILEVAKYLKVAERTVYRLAAAKKIPAFKVGGAWRFSRVEIDQWIKKQSSAVLGTEGVSAVGPGRRS
jgi:excisionase family DNA binding protein